MPWRVFSLTALVLSQVHSTELCGSGTCRAGDVWILSIGKHLRVTRELFGQIIKYVSMKPLLVYRTCAKLITPKLNRQTVHYAHEICFGYLCNGLNGGRVLLNLITCYMLVCLVRKRDLYRLGRPSWLRTGLKRGFGFQIMTAWRDVPRGHAYCVNSLWC